MNVVPVGAVAVTPHRHDIAEGAPEMRHYRQVTHLVEVVARPGPPCVEVVGATRARAPYVSQIERLSRVVWAALVCASAGASHPNYWVLGTRWRGNPGHRIVADHRQTKFVIKRGVLECEACLAWMATCARV